MKTEPRRLGVFAWLFPGLRLAFERNVMAKELPLLCHTDMVKAILDGRKTVTRRVIDFKKIAKQSGCTKGRLFYSKTFKSWAVEGNGAADICLVNARYQKGDLLYVRERINNGLQSCNFYYHADNKGVGNEIYKRLCDYGWTLKKVIPSIHMPKWATRLWLEVLDVRAERLQEISISDLRAEGLVFGVGATNQGYIQWKELWNKLNAKRGYSWESNPWVWRYEFKRIQEYPKREQQKPKQHGGCWQEE